jgi:WD40 repeat protein
LLLPADNDFTHFSNFVCFSLVCVLQVNHENQSPVLSTCFSSDGSTVFSGGVDNAVRMWQLGQTPTNNVPQQIGVHDSPVKAVGFLKSTNLIVSGGWDRKLKFWDARSPNPAGPLPTFRNFLFVVVFLRGHLRNSRARGIVFSSPPAPWCDRRH